MEQTQARPVLVNILKLTHRQEQQQQQQHKRQGAAIFIILTLAIKREHQPEMI